jgi:hypothetical protein
MDPCSFERLVAALSLCVGIEAHINLRDVCGLSVEDAREVKRWAARALLEVGLAETEQASSESYEGDARTGSGKPRRDER